MRVQSGKSLLVGSAGGAAAAALTAMGAAVGLTSAELIVPVLAGVLVLATLLHDAKQSITEMVDNRTKTLRKKVGEIRRDTGDIHGLVRIQPYTRELPLPVGGGWALTGDSAAILAREALVRAPAAIVELGSGASTLMLGQILKARGNGHLLSIDHDAKWAAETRRNVEFLGLQDVVTIVVAPLKAMQVEGQEALWYDIPEQALEQLGMIDLLLVDGPPHSGGQNRPARYPAVPLLFERLSADALVFVDDASRSSETAMVDEWLRRYPGWEVQRFNTVDGVCLLSRIKT
jgi:predicted O-methyltransferase YrrM